MKGGGMANQHTGNFEAIVQEKCQCSAQALLEKAAQEGWSYDEVAHSLNLKQGTVRKWATRFGLKLISQPTQAEQTNNQYYEKFHAPGINVANFLSRFWGIA